jgi:putative ABC transport system ATP-binding protein
VTASALPGLATSGNIIETVGLRKVYEDAPMPVPALDDVTLSIGHGEVVALVGPSGSGKSTLLNILGCLDRPTQGRYYLGGSDVSKLDRTAQAWVRLHYIGFIFQSFHLIPHSTALENVALPLYYSGESRSDSHDRAAALLERVGLGQRMDHRPAQLSGGQRQRVAIARSLACHPKLLLADEPTGALDSHTGKEVLELLFQVHREENLTVLLVTHDPAIAAQAHRRIEFGDGRVINADAEARPHAS